MAVCVVICSPSGANTGYGSGRPGARGPFYSHSEPPCNRPVRWGGGTRRVVAGRRLSYWVGGDAVGQPAPDGGIAGVADGVGEEVGEGGIIQQALGQQRGGL